MVGDEVVVLVKTGKYREGDEEKLDLHVLDNGFACNDINSEVDLDLVSFIEQSIA